MINDLLIKPYSYSWSIIFRVLKWFTKPVVVFVLLQIVWVAVTLLWVIWFVNQNEAIAALSRALGDQNITLTYGLAVLTIGCILLGIMLLGMVLLFTFLIRQTSLIRQQKSFVSSVTHELKSPLASLQLSFETLQRKNLPETIFNKLINMVETDIERLINLVNRILISSQLDRGVFEFGSKESFNLKELLSRAANQSQHMDANLSQRLIIKCPKELTVRTLKMPLAQIVSNLLENALKYSPPSTPIKIEAVKSKNGILISIHDEGYGILKKDLRRIFRMFYRSGLATKKAIPGTGLGLYIISSTVEMMGGKVWAASDGPGKGATFFVQLPS